MKFKIKIESAIETIRKNLDAHIVELKDAQDVWIKDVHAELQKLRDAVDREGINASHDRLNSLFYNRPKDNRMEYSRFLGALKRAQESGESIVEMDWEWRRSSGGQQWHDFLGNRSL